ncbi:MAG: hypothetical protein ABIJ00_13005 [Candidatus Eisenbacteria bacterium]
MRWHRVGISTLVFLGLVLVGFSGVLRSQGDERLMLVFTTGTEGELNACG